MTKQYQVYRCSVCGNVIEVLWAGGGQLVCCGQPMILMEAKAKDEGQEKHLPVVIKLEAKVCRGGDGYIVKVGAIPHPMEEKHYIEWVEIITADGKRGKKYLQPGDKPEVEFHFRAKAVAFRAYCNIHGLWQLTL